MDLHITIMLYELCESMKVSKTMNTMQTIKNHVVEVLKANKIELTFTSKLLSKERRYIVSY